MEAPINISIDLQGKRALVCGASQGIGRAIAHGLALADCQVLALSRSQEKLESAVRGFPGNGHIAIVGDLSERQALMKKVENELAKGPIHILINNTGGPPPGAISTATPEAFLKAFEQHILAASDLAQAVLPGMKQSGFGRILNIISTSVKIPIANLGVSNTIRGAMANWAKTLSLEVASFGITVNNILPGFTKTPRLDSLLNGRASKEGKTRDQIEQSLFQSIPAGRFGEPEEVAAAAVFLASSQAAYINGINLPVDGGRTGCL